MITIRINEILLYYTETNNKKQAIFPEKKKMVWFSDEQNLNKP